MSSKLAELFVEIGARTKGLDAGLDASKGKLTSFGGWASSLLAGVASGVTQAALSAAASLAAGLGGTIRGWIKDAGDLNETLSKSEVVFGSANQKILGFARNMEESFGTSKREIVDAASSFGLIFKGVEMAEADSADLAIKLATAADDAASLFNSELPEALEKIRAGLVGESEPLRAYGVMLNEAAVQQEALRLGLAKSKDALSEQAKVQARASLIAKGLAVAAGDHARTQSGLNNRFKEFGDRLKNFGASVGSWFIGPMNLVLGITNNALKYLTSFADMLGNLVGRMLTFGASARDAAGSVDKVAEAAKKGNAAAAAKAAAPAAKADKDAFDARKEILKEEKEAAEERAKGLEREKRAAELKEDLRRRQDLAVANAIGFRNFGDASDAQVESSRRLARFDDARASIDAFKSRARGALSTGLGMAGALRDASLTTLDQLAGALLHEPARRNLNYGVTDAESYYREVQDAALKDAGKTQAEIRKELEKHTTKFDELIKAVRQGAGRVVGVFG